MILPPSTKLDLSTSDFKVIEYISGAVAVYCPKYGKLSIDKTFADAMETLLELLVADPNVPRISRD